MAVAPVPTAAPPQPTAAPSPPARAREADESKQQGRLVAISSFVCDFKTMKAIHLPLDGVHGVYNGMAMTSVGKVEVVVKTVFKAGYVQYMKHQKKMIEELRKGGVPHVSPLFGVLEDVNDPFFADKSYDAGRNYSLVFPYLGKTLREVSREDGHTLKYWRCVARQLFETVSALAARKVAHHDLSYKNVVMEQDPPVVHVIDWEASSDHILTDSEPRAVCHFRAPEYFLRVKEYGPPVDIWAMGCLFHYMATGGSLFSLTESTTFTSILTALGMPSHEFVKKCGKAFPPIRAEEAILLNSHARNYEFVVICALVKDKTAHLDEAKAFTDLMSKMLVWEPEMRITAVEALKHPFFTEANKWR